MALDGKMGEGVVALGELCESAFCYCNGYSKIISVRRGKGCLGSRLFLFQSIGLYSLFRFCGEATHHDSKTFSRV